MEDRAAVANVLDGAVLETDDARLQDSIERGETFVAVTGRGEVTAGATGPDAGDDERVLGALVLDGDRIVSIAVRRRRRGQGIGTALVERAAGEREHLTAEFDERVRPFYESLGFDIEPVEGDEARYRAIGDF